MRKVSRLSQFVQWMMMMMIDAVRHAENMHANRSLKFVPFGIFNPVCLAVGNTHPTIHSKTEL